MKCILSTCGTSFLTNSADDELRKLITKNANASKPEEIDAGIHDRLAQHCQQQHTQILAEQDLTKLQNLSAELNGIISLYEQRLDQHKGDHHILVRTDTWLGEQAARTIEAWLQKHGFSVDVWKISYLQTKELERFNIGMAYLVEQCAKKLPGFSKAGYQVIFNLIGGFKSVQGFLQTLGMFYADESVYMFQSSKELLRLPRLPLRLDAEDMVNSHLQAFRRASMNLPMQIKDFPNLPYTLFTTIAGDIMLSPWGVLIWRQHHKAVQGKELFLQPISSMLRYGPKFDKTVKDAKLNADQLAIVNQRLDELARYLENGTNTKGLDFKQLTSNIKGKRTHECDVNGEWRLFGHYEGAIFTIDSLDKPLHKKKLTKK